MYNLEKIKKKEGKETLITTQTMSQNSSGLVFDQSAFITDLQEAISVTGPDLGDVIQSFQERFYKLVYLNSEQGNYVYRFGDEPSGTNPNLVYNFETKQFQIFNPSGTDIWVEIEPNLNERYPEECFTISRNYNYYRGMSSWKKWWKGRKLIEENNQIWSEMVINSVKEFLLDTSSKKPKELLADWNIPLKYFSVSNKKEKFLTIFEVLKDGDYLIDNDSPTFSQFIYHTLNSITVRDEETTSEFDTEMVDELIYLLLNLGREVCSQSLKNIDVYWKDKFILSLEAIFYYFEEEYNISGLELLQRVKDRLSKINEDELLAHTFPKELIERTDILWQYWKTTMYLLDEINVDFKSQN